MKSVIFFLEIICVYCIRKQSDCSVEMCIPRSCTLNNPVPLSICYKMPSLQRQLHGVGLTGLTLAASRRYHRSRSQTKACLVDSILQTCVGRAWLKFGSQGSCCMPNQLIWNGWLTRLWNWRLLACVPQFMHLRTYPVPRWWTFMTP